MRHGSDRTYGIFDGWIVRTGSGLVATSGIMSQLGSEGTSVRQGDSRVSAGICLRVISIRGALAANG